MPVQIDVVAGIVGFDTAAYSVGYIAGWSGAGTAIIKATASRVLAAAHHIAEILDPTDYTEPAARWQAPSRTPTVPVPGARAVPAQR